MRRTEKKPNYAVKLTHALANRAVETVRAICGRRRAAVMAAAMLAGWALLAGPAHASCGPSRIPKQGVAFPGSQAFPDLAGMEPSFQSKPGSATIVGLWHVRFVSNGALYDEGFDQFHADGTEILNDDGVPPAEGNVCLGVYKRTGPGSYKLKHPAFVWDATGNLVGTLVIREAITLDPGHGSYKGSFVFDFYDLAGNLTDEVTGDLTGKRITVD